MCVCGVFHKQNLLTRSSRGRGGIRNCVCVMMMMILGVIHPRARFNFQQQLFRESGDVGKRDRDITQTS